jgi:uncharacterized protein (TIGR03083 family)
MDHLALLAHEVDAMTEALRAADPAAPVEACPGWTMRDLAGHVTGVHRWVLAALSSDAPPPYDETPTDGDLVATYAAAANEMVSALTALPPGHACWTFDRGNRSASFWRRRQLHEIAVHRWDVQPYPLTDEVAVDGLDEVVDFLLPRQLAAGRTTLPDGALELRSPGRTWTLGEGTTTVVEGPAGELLLSLWGRRTPLPGPWAETRLTP